jgi:hypothetical protein
MLKDIEQLKSGETATVTDVVDDSLFLQHIGLTRNVKIRKIQESVYRFRGATFYIRPSKSHKIYVSTEEEKCSTK